MANQAFKAAPQTRHPPSAALWSFDAHAANELILVNNPAAPMALNARG